MSKRPLVYVDTSAFGALLVAQAETESLVEWLDTGDVTLVSSDLLETELRRMAVREERDQARVTAILDGVSLAALDRATYRSAGFLPMPYLRTLDALHLEAAMRLDVDGVLTYDHRLAEGASAAGLDVFAPGRNEPDESDATSMPGLLGCCRSASAGGDKSARGRLRNPGRRDVV